MTERIPPKGQTVVDIEVSPVAPSPEAIRAFWERLGAFFDPWDTDERRVLEEALDAAYAADEGERK